LRVAATGAVDPEKKVKVIRFSVFDKSLFYVFILYFFFVQIRDILDVHFRNI